MSIQLLYLRNNLSRGALWLALLCSLSVYGESEITLSLDRENSSIKSKMLTVNISVQEDPSVQQEDPIIYTQTIPDVETAYLILVCPKNKRKRDYYRVISALGTDSLKEWQITETEEGLSLKLGKNCQDGNTICSIENLTKQQFLKRGLHTLNERGKRYLDSANPHDFITITTKTKDQMVFEDSAIVIDEWPISLNKGQ